ncbi:MAG: polyprenol monophosphomannose synthase [bacterium]
MLSVIVPTYNEAKNIQPLLREVQSVLDNSTLGPYEILVVDDDSPDKTWKLVQEVADGERIRLVRRKDDRGLARAVLRGLQESRYEHVVVMDADFQHPPEAIPRLVQKLQSGDDVVVASRYVDGGDVRDFGTFRKLLSIGANMIARIVLEEVRTIKDPLAGYFAFRKSIIEEKLPHPLGYKILLTILVEGDYESVSEIGYTFEPRRAGDSKLGLKNIYYFLAHLGKLYFS